MITLQILTLDIETLETTVSDFGTARFSHEGTITATNSSTNTEFYKNLKEIYTYGYEGERDEAIVYESKSTLGHIYSINTMIDADRVEQSLELLKAEAMRIRKSNYIVLADTISRAHHQLAKYADS